MKSRQVSHRFKAAWALGELGPLGRKAAPQLIKAVDDENVGVQINAIRALTSLEIVDDTLPPKLRPRLNDSNLEMSGCAGALLSLHAQKSKDPAYLQMFLNASSPRTRLMSLPLLADPQKDSQLRSVAFGALLNDTNGWVREETVKFLKRGRFNETNLISSSRAANLATMQF
jgi:HEAT repeat protein